MIKAICKACQHVFMCPVILGITACPNCGSADTYAATEADPYEAFEAWCKANGYGDVIDCQPADVDLKRLNEATDAYGASR